MDQNYQQPVQQTAAQPSILPLGIVSLILAFTAYGGIVGLILAIIGRKKGKAYIAQGGTLEGQAKTGFGLCKAGLILGIIGIICAVIVTIIVAVTGTALNNLASQINY